MGRKGAWPPLAPGDGAGEGCHSRDGVRVTHPACGAFPSYSWRVLVIGRGGSPEHVGQEGLVLPIAPAFTVFTQHLMVPALPCGAVGSVPFGDSSP